MSALDVRTASELVALIRAKEVSSTELLAHQVARIERLNPSLNAVVALDLDRAFAAARVADDATARGESHGALHGLPMTVKDVWETEGVATTSGAPALRDHVPRADAPAVARLRSAGAIIFGKTNTPLYAGDFQTYNEVFGVTNNPWDETRTAGGSSGGSAVAVAAGLTSLELGSDIAGSIRNPAHYNGVYGLKPSWGVVPSRGHIPGPPGSLVETDVNCGGPLSRGVADLGLCLDVLAGPLPEDAVAWRLELDPGPPINDATELRVASVCGAGTDFLPIAADVLDRLEAFVQRVAHSGATVDVIEPPVPLADGMRTWEDLVLPIIGTGLPEDDFAAFAALDAIPDDDPLANAARAIASRYRSWAQSNGRRQRERAAWAELFQRYDVVIAPVMPTTAFPHDVERPLPERMLDVDGHRVSHLRAMAWCGAIGSVLLPVVTVPTGNAPSGLPVGAQLIGPFLSDARLVAIATMLDAAAGAGFTPPTL